MKKIISLALCFAMLICTGIFGCISVSANTNDDGHYQWTFENAALNDDTNGIYKADTGNNTLTRKNVDNPTFPANAAASGVVAGSYVALSESAVSSQLGNALWAAGVYFELENSIDLKHDAAWYIEITGRIPNGTNGRQAAPLPDTALFAGADNEMFVNGNGTAFSFTKTVAGEETYYAMKDNENWDDENRIGQNRKQTLTVWNEYNTTTQQWEIHWMTERHGGTDTWSFIDCKSTVANGVDFTFTTMGNETNYFGANTWGDEIGKYGAPYITSIEIFEDLGTFANTPINQLPEGMINTPQDGVAFSKTINLGELSDTVSASIEWTDEEGTQKNKAHADNTYTATVTLTPALGYEFSSSITVPAEYTSFKINDDGTATLTKVFTVAAAEGTGEEEASGENTSLEGTEAEETEAVEEERKGCKSSVGAGAFAIVGIISLGAAATVGKKRKQNK